MFDDIMKALAKLGVIFSPIDKPEDYEDTEFFPQMWACYLTEDDYLKDRHYIVQRDGETFQRFVARISDGLGDLLTDVIEAV